jgi:hypothetical protein
MKGGHACNVRQWLSTLPSNESEGRSRAILVRQDKECTFSHFHPQRKNDIIVLFVGLYSVQHSVTFYKHNLLSCYPTPSYYIKT